MCDRHPLLICCSWQQCCAPADAAIRAAASTRTARPGVVQSPGARAAGAAAAARGAAPPPTVTTAASVTAPSSSWRRETASGLLRTAGGGAGARGWAPAALAPARRRPEACRMVGVLAVRRDTAFVRQWAWLGAGCGRHGATLRRGGDLACCAVAGARSCTPWLSGFERSYNWKCATRGKLQVAIRHSGGCRRCRDRTRRPHCRLATEFCHRDAVYLAYATNSGPTRQVTCHPALLAM